jgi:hypothetical protein
MILREGGKLLVGLGFHPILAAMLAEMDPKCCSRLKRAIWQVLTLMAALEMGHP